MSHQNVTPATTPNSTNEQGIPGNRQSDLTPALRALILDELLGRRLTASRYLRMKHYARAMGLSERQFEELFEQCCGEVSANGLLIEAPRPLWMSLTHWLSNKWRALMNQFSPNDR
jgi:hypothetical protein